MTTIEKRRASAARSMRRLRAGRKAAGLCVDCGRPRAGRSKSRCSECLERLRATMMGRFALILSPHAFVNSMHCHDCMLSYMKDWQHMHPGYVATKNRIARNRVMPEHPFKHKNHCKACSVFTSEARRALPFSQRPLPADGLCENGCGKPLSGGPVELAHVFDVALGGDTLADNVRWTLKACNASVSMNPRLMPDRFYDYTMEMPR